MRSFLCVVWLTTERRRGDGEISLDKATPQIPSDGGAFRRRQRCAALSACFRLTLMTWPRWNS